MRGRCRITLTFVVLQLTTFVVNGIGTNKDNEINSTTTGAVQQVKEQNKTTDVNNGPVMLLYFNIQPIYLKRGQLYRPEGTALSKQCSVVISKIMNHQLVKPNEKDLTNDLSSAHSETTDNTIPLCPTTTNTCPAVTNPFKDQVCTPPHLRTKRTKRTLDPELTKLFTEPKADLEDPGEEKIRQKKSLIPFLILKTRSSLRKAARILSRRLHNSLRNYGDNSGFWGHKSILQSPNALHPYDSFGPKIKSIFQSPNALHSYDSFGPKIKSILQSPNALHSYDSFGPKINLLQGKSHNPFVQHSSMWGLGRKKHFMSPFDDNYI